MKRNFQSRIVLECMGMLVYCCLIAFPYLGIAFLISLALAAVAAFGFDSTSALGFLAVSWKVYIAVALLSFPFYTTHWFLDSEVGDFKKYLARYGLVSVRGDFLAALIWPITWTTMGSGGPGAGNSFAAAVIEVGQYWLVDRQRIKAGKSVAH